MAGNTTPVFDWHQQNIALGVESPNARRKLMPAGWPGLCLRWAVCRSYDFHQSTTEATKCGGKSHQERSVPGMVPCDTEAGGMITTLDHLPR